MATDASRFREMPPTVRTLSATSAGRAEICRRLTPLRPTRRRAERSVAPRADVRILRHVSEKASEFPEPRRSLAASPSSSPSASASPGRSRSRSSATSATVRHLPLLPWRSWIVTRSLSLVASRPQMLTVLLSAEIGDEREPEGGHARLGPGVLQRRRVEVEPALVRARARVVLEQEPRHERHAREPHLVQRLGRPASGKAERRRMLPRRIRVPAELRHPELNRMRRDDVADRTPAFSTARIFGRSPSSTSSGASRARTAPRRCTDDATRRRSAPALLQVACGCEPFERQSSERMKASGADRVPLLLVVLGVPERIEAARDDEVCADRRRAPHRRPR